MTLPLNEMDVYESPRPRWYKLRSKPGKEKQKDRGELEVRIGFTVKSGSLTDLSGKKEKHKSSIGQLNVGGSLLSINTLEKRKNLKKFAKSLGSKMHITGKKKDKKGTAGGGGEDSDSMAGSTSNVWPTPDQQRRRNLGGLTAGQMAGEADPGVISEDDDEFAFENLSHKSSGSSLNVNRGQQQQVRLSGGQDRRSSPAISNNSSSTADMAGFTATRNDDHHADGVDVDAYANRSMTLPTPPKPKRTAVQAQDEWAEKLYGKSGSGSLGSSDSLKRRSWEPSPVATGRVPIESVSSTRLDEMAEVPEEVVVAPNPVMKSSTTEIRSSLPATAAAATAQVVHTPQPLPRHSMENVGDPQQSAKVKKSGEKENKFTKKLKYLRDFGRGTDAGSASPPGGGGGGERKIKPTLSGQFYNNQSERIIIGHENDVKQQELPKEVIQRYEGKTREVSEGIC